MEESASNLLFISSNLTNDEFKGFCKGMSLKWINKALAADGDNSSAGKRVKFWDNAYDKYSHNCAK